MSSSHPRLLTTVAFAGTAAQFGLTYAIPATSLPWPIGLAATVAPIAIGVPAVRRLATTSPYGRDGRRVVTAILAFFVLDDLFVALTGRYDLFLTAALTIAGLIWLNRVPRSETGGRAMTPRGGAPGSSR